MKPLLSAKETTTLLAIGSRKLWELTNCGAIPHVRIGRAIRYDPDDLEAWVRRSKRRGPCSSRAIGSACEVTSADEGSQALGEGVG